MEKRTKSEISVDDSKRAFLKKSGMVLLATGAYQVISLFVEAPASQAWCMPRNVVRVPKPNCGVRGLRETLPSPVDQWSSPPEAIPTKLRGAPSGTQSKQQGFPEINEKTTPAPKGES